MTNVKHTMELECEIRGLKYKTQLYDEFFDAVNITDAIDVVREWKRNDELWKKLEPLFLNIVGEYGDNEGAVDVLTRLIKERDNLKEQVADLVEALKESK